MRDLSIDNKSAYFTGAKEAATLLQLADQFWSLKGKTVLEPAAGSGIFPLTSERHDLGIRWLTNELFPQHTNFVPDTEADFLTLEPQDVDAVIGNPPYTGQVSLDGKRMNVCEAFIHRAFLWSDRVAFVLPLPMLKPKSLARLPEGVRLRAWTAPKEQTYTVAGSGGGSQKLVKTTICFFERDGFPGYPFDGSPIPGLEWVPRGDSRATHVVSGWGTPGLTKALDGSWGSKRKMSRQRHCVITDPRIEKILATEVIADFCSRWTNGPPYASGEDLNWYLRCLLEQWPE